MPELEQHHEDSKRRPAVGVGVMVLRGGKCLLGRRQGTHGAHSYGWVGGGLRFGETLEEVARREAVEEAGLVLGELRLLCVSNIREYEHHYIDFEFLCEESEGEPRIMEPEFQEDWGWYDPANPPQPLFRATELGLQAYRTGQFYNP
jgi:8-oxo-dGTP diphosphatase